MIRPDRTDWLRLIALIAPPERAEWVDAMASEMMHLPRSARPGFALGCLHAAFAARVRSTGFAPLTTRILLTIGAAVWSLLNIRFAVLMADSGDALLVSYGAVNAAMFAMGAASLARIGGHAVVRPASALIAISMLGLVAASTLAGVPANASLYRALLIENLCVLTIGLVTVMVAARTDVARRTEQ